MRGPNSCHLNTLWIARKRAGLGQKTVARPLGHKNASTISEYEREHLPPSLRTALKVAAIYHMPVAELYAALSQEVEREAAIAEQKYPASDYREPTPALPIQTFRV